MTTESQSARDGTIDTSAIVAAVALRLPRIILVLLIALAAAFVILSFLPRVYESSAGILVEPRSNVYLQSPGNAPPQPSGNEEGVVSSQIELLKSRDTLLGVVRSEGLDKIAEFNGTAGGASPIVLLMSLFGHQPSQPSVEEVALNSLFDHMTVMQERDSRIITVTIRSTDSQLAARLANAVAKAHVARRAELSLSDTAEASGWLKAEIDKLRTSVTQAESAVANFKVDNNLLTGANNGTLVDQQLSSMTTQMSAALERKNTALSRATLIRGLIDRNQPIEGVPDVRDSVVIQQLSQQKAQLQSERAQKSATFLGGHPIIRALDAQIVELNKQIGIEGRRVADALEAEAQIEEGIQTKMQGDLDALKGSASTATRETVTLDSLQREAKAQRDLLEGYLQRYGEAISRTDAQSALPDVRVVTLAAPSVAPASPKTMLVLLAVGSVALFGQIGLIVFGELLSGRAISPYGYETMPQRAGAFEPLQPVRAQDRDTGSELVVYEYQAEPEPADTVEPFEYDTEFEDLPEPIAAEFVEEPEPFAPAVEVAEPVTAIEPEPVELAVDPEPEATAPVELAVDPEAEAIEQAAPPAPLPMLRALDYATLSSDLVLGRTRVLVLAGKASHRDCAKLATVLAADSLDRGLSVAVIDAGSGHPSTEPGIADLSVERASFGDVVHKSTEEGLAEVPWGHARAIDRRSGRPLTLVEALSDIYEVVILMTGRIGVSSTLPMFAEIGGRLVLVAGAEADPDEVKDACDQLSEAGYGDPDVVLMPQRAAA